MWRRRTPDLLIIKFKMDVALLYSTAVPKSDPLKRTIYFEPIRQNSSNCFCFRALFLGPIAQGYTKIASWHSPGSGN